MKKRVGLSGASGRMGAEIQRALQPAKDLELTVLLCRENSAKCGALGECGTELRYSVFEPNLQKVDGWIDFSSPKNSLRILDHCIEKKLPLVLGATPYTAEDLAQISAASLKIPIFQAANFSYGVAVLRNLVVKAAHSLGPSFDVHISEAHHKAKKDAPSGTALLLRNDLEQKASREMVPCSSLRGGDIVGEHSVHFSGPGERIELVHRATQRSLFAIGAVRAFEWLLGQPAGLYAMEDLIVGSVHKDLSK